METYTRETFIEMIKSIDDNPYDLSGFIVALSERYPDLYETDIDDVKDYIEVEIGIESDQEICGIDDEKIDSLCDYINQLLKDLSDDY